jgi:hypothetical protein
MATRRLETGQKLAHIYLGSGQLRSIEKPGFAAHPKQDLDGDFPQYRNPFGT